MRLAVILPLIALSNPAPVSSQNEQAGKVPFMQLNCKTVDALDGSEFNSKTATIIMSVPFEITKSDRRLKFYRSMIAFGQNKAFQIVQPRITSEEMSDKSGRFGNLRTRQADDDIPTTFVSRGVEYEVQTVTGFMITERLGEKSFKINLDDPIKVKIEVVTGSSERDPPVWVGECLKTGLLDQQ